MKTRTLGSQGLKVSALGYGCMSLTGAYGATAGRPQAEHLIHAAIDLGYTLFDTAPIYGGMANEELLGSILQGKRDQVLLSTKFGLVLENGRIDRTDSRPETIRESVEASLMRLKTDHIDILFQHRVDPAVPIEETVGEMGRLVAQGKVRYLGLSEASAANIRRAHAIHPISAVQSEYSLLERGVEERVIPTIRELGIGLMPFSPLGRGLIGGAQKAAADLPKSDYRRLDPRYQGENYEHNMNLVQQLASLAQTRGITPAQLALAWILHKNEDIVPLIGTLRLEAIRENEQATAIELTPEMMDRLDALFAVNAVSGVRYPPSMMRFVDPD
ncbi:aldo/keto reductase [Lacisediminimonas profundi]|uniref:aldo/keto reductase n=1 Tax=Lacisediminimonas profundi TaxID=2603856 RepID=UPI00124B43E8|nr:aldo/keto reductase [Lacisediminimonas profundi]